MRSNNPMAGLRKLAAGLVLTGTLVLAGAGTALAAGVDMVDDDYSPAQVTIEAGQSVTFTNAGDRPHTATADDGSFDTGALDPGSSATVTLNSPGTYRYYCQFHGGPGGDGMSGVITVTGAAGGGASGGGAAGGSGGSAGGTGGSGEAAANSGGPAAQAPVLPQTATPLPLIAGAGVVVLCLGLLLGRRRLAR
jgi:plastocyanin